MAVTDSTMLPLGTPAPAFSLVDAVSGRTMSLGDFAAKKALVVMFLCNHCPFVKHLRTGLASFANDYANDSVAIVAISSNDAVAYPADSPEMMKVEVETYGYSFPYLFDESQDAAKAFQAACTPDFYLFDRERRLVYRGRFDDARPGNAEPVDGHCLRAAVDAVLADAPVSEDQTPSAGCNIKWKAGNAPVFAP